MLYLLCSLWLPKSLFRRQACNKKYNSREVKHESFVRHCRISRNSVPSLFGDKRPSHHSQVFQAASYFPGIGDHPVPADMHHCHLFSVCLVCMEARPHLRGDAAFCGNRYCSPPAGDLDCRTDLQKDQQAGRRIMSWRGESPRAFSYSVY